MDVVLVGLPGSGKTAVGRRLARRHDAEFIDLDALVEANAGRRVPDIFADEGEAGFRARERATVAALGPPDPAPDIRRIIATGGGAVVDPRNRWRLYRGRAAIWLDGRPEVIAQRLVRSPNVRPLIVGREPVSAVRALAAERARFYAAAARVSSVAELQRVVDAAEDRIRTRTLGATMLVAADTAIGRFRIGDRIAGVALVAALDRAEAQRAIVVTEPTAWAAVEDSIRGPVEAAGRSIELVLLPGGEAAKRLAVIEAAADRMASLRAERGEPIVAIGGGAVGDTAGFLAAVWLRGVPLIQLPTTLAAQIDSSIGGKTAVDIDAGKNLVGAFHQPADIVIDVALLRSLPARELRAALGEAVKMGLLGDERLLELLAERGTAIAAGTADAFDDGSIAELVERCAWAKVETVLADERETGDARIRLNLGHTVGHAIEAADGYTRIRHGEAVAYGLRAACHIGVAIGSLPPERARLAETLLDGLGLGVEPLSLRPEEIAAAIDVDKKHRAGRQRWVLPTASGVEVRDDVPEAVVLEAVGAVVAGSGSVPIGERR
jgi:3-dehydroquinate synthetase/shikimate kinase